MDRNAIIQALLTSLPELTLLSAACLLLMLDLL